MHLLRLLQRPVALALLLAAACCVNTAHAQLPTTQLTSIFPAGAKAGSELEVNVGGDNLDELDQLVFSHPGITAAQKMGEPLMPGKPARPVLNTFTLKVAGDVPPGAYEARVKGRFGLSNPRTFVIGTLEEVIESAGTNEASKAQEIAVGSVVNGRVEQNNRDYFKLALKSGERVIIDCRAGGIDSRFDPAIAIINAEGRELARAHDATSKDPVIDFTAPQESTYTIMLYDFLYGGGPEYAYRLAVHKAPVVDFTFPAAGVAGSQASVTLYGRNLPGGQPAGISLGGAQLEKVTATVTVPSDPTQTTTSASLPHSSLIDTFDYRLQAPSGSSNPVLMGIATEPVVLEQEPNNEPQAAQKVNVPCELNGQFYPARDRDYVQFDLKKGDVYTIEVVAHRLGLQSDPALTIQRVTKNDKGEEVANNVAQVDDPQDRQNRIGGDFDTSTDDASYRLTAPEDGTYRVLVRDNFGESRTDPRSVYRLIIRQAKPDFRLAAYLDLPTTQNNQNRSSLDAPVLRKGGTLELRVALDRRDNFAGEITINVEGLPAGVTCPGAVAGGTTESASLVLTAAESVASWSGPIKIIGKATINGQEVTRHARVGTCVWGTQDRNQRPPQYRIARDLVLSTMDKEMQPALVIVGEDKVYETSRGGNLEIPIKVSRRDGFNESIKLSKANLPNEIQMKDLTIAGGAGEGKLEVQLNQQNIKPGTYTFYLKGETKLKYARNPDAIKTVEAEQAEFAEYLKMLQEETKKADAEKNTTATAASNASNERNQAEGTKKTLDEQAQQAADAAKQAADKLALAKDAASKDAGNQALAEAAAAAQKQADDAAAAAKAAADKAIEGEKALVAAQEKLKAAEEAKAKAEQTAKEMQDRLNQANQQKQQLEQRVSNVKKDNQSKDVQLALVSTPVRIRVTESPVKLTLGQASLAGKQGEKLELPVSIERLYGYAEGVEVTCELPNGLGGINVKKADLKKEEAQGKVELTLGNDAKVGEHVLTIRARARFNNVQCDTEQTVTLKVDAAPAK